MSPAIRVAPVLAKVAKNFSNPCRGAGLLTVKMPYVSFDEDDNGL